MDEEQQKRWRYDQDTALIGDCLPTLWRRLFVGAMEAGFSRDEALSLVRAFIHGAASGTMEK